MNEMFNFKKHIPVVPMVRNCEYSEKTVKIPARISAPELYRAEADTFKETVSRLFSADMENGEGGIELTADPSLKKDEYRISCEDRVKVYFSDREGLLYAFATLIQLLHTDREVNTFTMTACEMQDKPCRGYRGLMVDSARKYHSMDDLYKMIDLCFLFKMKYLQIHFNDANAFTLPLSVITERGENDCWYTRRNIADLNAYAHAKGVIIVPEIEMPGHSRYLISELKKEHENHVHDNAVCAHYLEHFDIFRDMIRETAELFPESPYIHIGADEVNTDEWDSCEECRSYCEKHGLASSRELYCRFVKMLTDEVIRIGKRPIVWEGFPKEAADEISKETIVMVFESYYHQANELVEEGFDVINASWNPLYITPDISWPIVNIYNWNPKSFSNWITCSPATKNPVVIDRDEKVLGGQLCSWECTFDEEIGAVKRNIVSLSERLWTADGESNNSIEFMERYYGLRPLIAKILA